MSDETTTEATRDTTESTPPTTAVQCEPAQPPGGAERENMKPMKGSNEDPGPETQWTVQQRRLLSALLAETNIQKAAMAAGVGRTTAHRWLKQPAFRGELARQREAMLSEALSSLKAYAVRAVNELMGLLGTSDERLRRQTCNDILRHAMKIRDMDDFEQRLVALEKAAPQEKKHGRYA